MRFVLDVAFMLWQQGQVAGMMERNEDAAMYLMTDSYPQGGVTWQISSYDMIMGSGIFELADEAKAFTFRWTAPSFVAGRV